MKRGVFVIMACVSLAAFSPQVGWAAAPKAVPGSPEAVVSKAMDAMNHGRVDEFIKAIHPGDLQEFRNVILEIFDLAAQQGKDTELLGIFEGIASAAKLKAMDAPRLYAAILRKMTSNPEVKKSLAGTRIDVIGHIPEGKDTVHVAYRSTMKLGELPVVRLNVASLRKHDSAWKLSLVDETAVRLVTLKQGLTGKRTPPDMAAARIDLLGHLLEGKETALVVYRMSIPAGDASISRLAAQSVNKNDPAWEAVQADNTAEIKSLIEKSLGITKPARVSALGTSPKPTPDPTPVPTETPSPRKSATSRSGRETMTPPRTARSQGKSARSRRPQSPSFDETESSSPNGLKDLPAEFFGSNRDRFHDIAPKGGVLVGARVSYIMRFGGPKISSIQPVYRVGEKLVNGERHGGLLGKETTAIAKPGYAVGTVKTHTGLTVDGFEMIFMRIDGDRLDSSDSYHSPWLGDENGGSPRNVSSEGKVPVGLQGRAGREVNALGLIVEE